MATEKRELRKNGDVIVDNGNRSNSEESSPEVLPKHKRNKVSKKVKLKEKRKRRRAVLEGELTSGTGSAGEDDEGMDLEQLEEEDTSMREGEVDYQPRLKKSKCIGYVKPDASMLDRERSLQKTATQGVIQLFNAVNKQQKVIEAKLKEAGSSETKRSKALSSIDKHSFVEMLKGNKRKSVNQKGDTTEPEVQDPTGGELSVNEVKEDTSSKKWDILRSDFMLGAAMKDWDKKENTDR